MRHNARIGRERRRGACRFLLIEAIAKRPRSGKLGIDRERRVHLVARAALVAPVEGPAGCAQMGLKSLPAFAAVHARPSCKRSSAKKSTTT